MATITGNARETLTVYQEPNTDFIGRLGAQIDTSIRISTGTGANQANLMHHDEDNALAGVTAEDIDLTALTDPYGAALSSLVEVCYFRLEWSASNAGNAEIKASAANGWSSVFKDPTDTIILLPGASMKLECWAAAAYTVGAANKSINVNNLGATAAAYKLTVIGRNA